MNEWQYERLRQNRRARQRPQAQRLVEATPRSRSGQSPLASALTAAAARQRRYMAAVAAWERVAEPAWLADASVYELRQRTLVIAVKSAVVQYELRRQQPVLERRLMELLRGLRQIRFVVATGGDGPELNPG